MIAELVSLNSTTCKSDWQTELDQKTILNEFSSKCSWRNFFKHTENNFISDDSEVIFFLFVGTTVSRGSTGRQNSNKKLNWL